MAAQSPAGRAHPRRRRAGLSDDRQPVCATLAAKQIGHCSWAVADPGPTELTVRTPLVPGSRTRYLAEIALAGREARARIEAQVEAARRAFGVYEALKSLHDAALPGPLERYPEEALQEAGADATRRALRAGYNRLLDEMGAEAVAELKGWPARARSATEKTYSYKVRQRQVTGENYTESLSRSAISGTSSPRSCVSSSISARLRRTVSA